MTPKLRVLLTTLLLAISSDQLTKAWVSANVPIGSPSEQIPLIDGFFYISHVRNPGAAFGLLLDWSWEARLFTFVMVAALAVMVSLSFFRGLAPGDRFNALALGLIMGGALGNLIDRVVRSEVVDFLHVRLWGQYAWPDFNLGDTFIVVGVGTLMLELLAAEGASRAAVTPAASDVDDDDSATTTSADRRPRA